MTRIEVDVINPVDFEFVMKILEALEQRRIIALRREVPILEETPEPEPDFPPMTVEKLNTIIEQSEKGPGMSLEAFKAKHNL